MRITEFKKLEEKITGQDFNKSYKNINIIMTVLSYFGHIASIFLAYFMLSKVISGAMTDNKIAVFIATVIILGGLELLKRDLFDKFSIQHIKIKTFGKDVMPLFLLSIAIIGASFYASITGAHEYSSKTENIEAKSDTVMLLESEKIKSEYASLISKQDSIFNLYETKIGMFERKKTLTDIQKENMGDWKSLRTEAKSEKTRLKTEMDEKIAKSEDKISSKTEKEKEGNSKNSLAFVIISTLIEIIILAGVYFNEYYKFRSYREFREKIERDPNFQKWMLYDQILSIVYTEDTKMNQKLPSSKGIIDICKINDIIVLNKDVANFLKTAAGLGIIKVSGSTRYINKQRDLSFETLRKNFNIK